MALIKTMDGRDLPALIFDGCSYTVATSVDGGRNTDGLFIGSTVGDDKSKWDLNFGLLTPDQMSNLLGLFDRTRGGHFVNRFLVWDASLKEYVPRELYVADRVGTPIVLDYDLGIPTVWKNVKTSLIER